MKKFYGFSLIEIMVALLIVSVILAVSAPVITKKGARQEKVTVERVVRLVDTVPVGAIVAWYGPNVPNGWLSLDGSQIDPKYDELIKVLDGDTNLPNFNISQAAAIESSQGNPSDEDDDEKKLIWIIKAENQKD